MIKFAIPHYTCAALIVLILSGCVSISSEIVGSDNNRVWIRKPIVGDGGADGIAAEYCAKFEKAAVFESEMTISDAKRIAVYICQ